MSCFVTAATAPASRYVFVEIATRTQMQQPFSPRHPTKNQHLVSHVDTQKAMASASRSTTSNSPKQSPRTSSRPRMHAQTLYDTDPTRFASELHSLIVSSAASAETRHHLPSTDSFPRQVGASTVDASEKPLRWGRRQAQGR